ncbi:hypothetical protein QBC45DRAFT_422550 [Copromyces sp. CBS 386.78]|uniref:Uncharacterized protein n=1 Tax=Pseudoneurospora amorphoporcata TaxID=241081 RepID=A0AAN6NRY0_9PEZI|nr:hypothetical protein QBC45DRAFT_422550 [Copromyces sp. CBS 386.78]KAK3949918.1 hypothetical protein QBC32DRAFT_348015 [Pseudoneurospora amorphoporcata]
MVSSLVEMALALVLVTTSSTDARKQHDLLEAAAREGSLLIPHTPCIYEMKGEEAFFFFSTTLERLIKTVS